LPHVAERKSWPGYRQALVYPLLKGRSVAQPGCVLGVIADDGAQAWCHDRFGALKMRRARSTHGDCDCR
jgi:hypothetical protein